MDRNVADDRYKWDLEAIYKDNKQFNDDCCKVDGYIKEISKYNGNMMDSADNFYDCLTLSYKIERLLDKLYSYSSLYSDLDTRDNSMQELKGRVINLYDAYNKASYFMVPNMLKYDYDDIVKFYNEVVELKDYDIVIKRIFRYKKHTLGEKEEKILSSIGKALGNNYNTYELLKDAELSFDNIKDENGNNVVLNNSTYSVYIESDNRDVRKQAFYNLYAKYKQYTNTFASLLFNNIKEEVEMAKIKNYNSAMEASLYADEVSPSIVDNLIKEVHNGLPTLYKYYDLKKKILGLDELHLYDIYTPIVKSEGDIYEYDKAVDIVLKALSVFGDSYVNTLREGINNRWIDVYPGNAKRTGGYSGGAYDTYPYILLNYQSRYSDMSTLAHEAGHSMHSYYTRSNNPYQYGDYSIFVAEVASTVNELLLANYMLENSDNEREKLNILDRLMELYKATIYRQTMFAEFERDIYNMAESDKTLTSDVLCEKYYELNKLYFGGDVIVDDEVRYEWERIPHFYYNFYVYKYATGLSAATKIVTDILNKREGAVDDYLAFLKCGRTKSPLESLKVAGVDLSSPSVIDSAIGYFDDVISRFSDIYDKLESNK